MSTTVTVDINEKEVIEKVTNDKVGLFAATEWKRLIDPYTPRDTGTLESTVELEPFTIHYKVPYAAYVYYGTYMNFQNKNPYSTDHWDKAAEGAGQKDKLIQAINDGLKSGRL